MSRFRTVRRLTLPVALICCVLYFILPARSADAPAAPQKVVTIEGITEYRLGNGLRILLFPDDSTPKVRINLTVLVGSRHEGYGETGMAHLLEHMLFKGTPTHTDIPGALKNRGATYNGTTWVDRTNYYEILPGTADNLEFAIRLEADRLVNSLIKREDLVQEMPVVRNEFEAGENDPSTILRQRMMAAAYEWHNYGKTTMGNRSDIERVPIERLQAFYHKYYRPDNAVLIVAGKFDPARALRHIAKYFGVLKRPARPIDATYTEEPAQDGERTVVLRRVGKIGLVGAMYHIPAGAHADFPAVRVLGRILTSEPSGRLYKALVETNKATEVSGLAQALHDPAVLELYAQASAKDSLPNVRDALLSVLEKLDKDKVTQEEVDRAKRQILADRDILMTRSSQIGIELSEWAAQGDWRLFFLYRDRVAKVTPADVQRVAAAYLKTANRTVGLYVPTDSPQRAPIPSRPDVAALVKNYKGRQALAAGEAFEPTPENIEKRVQRSRLPGGLQLGLLPKKTRGGAVVAVLNLHYGNEKSLGGITSATQFLGPLLMRGTKDHTRQQLEDALDKLGARLDAEGILGDLNVFLITKRDKLPAVLALLGEMLRRPTFPAHEFDLLKASAADSLKEQMDDPVSRASRLLQSRLNPFPPGDVRYVPTLEESLARLKKVTRDQVAKIYNEQVGGQSGEFVVVGEFDPEATKEQVEKFFAGWKAQVPYRRIPRPAVRGVKGGRDRVLIPDKEDAFYMAGLTLPLKDTDPDYPALRLASYVFGEGALASRLGKRVRKEEGSYTVRSAFTANAQDRAARFLMYATCKPVNMVRVDRAMAEELAKLLDKGVGTKELEDAKKSFLEKLKVDRSSDMSLTSTLADGLYLGRTFAFEAALEKKIAALTPGDLNGALKKHIDPKRLFIVQAGDLKKEEARGADGHKGK
jgi:zinc protease